MLLLFGGLGAGLYAYRTAHRYVPEDIFLIAPLSDMYILNANSTASPINTDVIRISRGTAIVTAGDRQAQITTFFSDAEYFEINFMNFIEGGAWSESEEDIPLIILNEALAWYLFGGMDITGLIIRVEGDSFPYEKFYRIIGIVRTDDTFTAWLPKAAHSVNISALYLREYQYGAVDISRYIEGIGMRHRILLYAVWLYIIILLFMTKSFSLRIASLVCAVLLLAGINDILLWLPNLANPNASIFINLPPEEYLSYGLRRVSRLNGYANNGWIVGGVGFINLMLLSYTQWQKHLP